VTTENVFLIETEAVSDQVTPFCLTHHSYFNLAGEHTGSIADHHLQIEADEYVPADAAMGLLGRLDPVHGKAADFTQPRRLGTVIPSLFQNHGSLYRIRDVRPNTHVETLMHAARLVDPASGRVLDVSTTAAYLQVYTASGLDGSVIGRSGLPYPRHAAICLECQGYPDGANAPHLGNIMLMPDQKKQESTAYAFSCEA
jgi:aldose 1-epimerase